MKNIMFIANGDKSRIQDRRHIRMENFYTPCIKALEGKEYNIYAGINCDIDDIYDKDGVHYFNQNVYRGIFALKDNLKAYRNINNIIKKYKIDVIHCNSPIGGLLGRICGHKNKVNTIIYTAHGFHFFKGNNPIKNFIFKNAEKMLAHYTNVIITMNQEDYRNAGSFRLKKDGKLFLVHGIGVDTKKYRSVNVDKRSKKRELGINDDNIVVVSVGDLVKNKNYELALKIIKKCNNKKIVYLICGKGPTRHELERIAAKLGIEKQVRMLGFRNDVKELYAISDIFLSTSKREGLPRSLMEAMASGLPCVVSNIRGNIDLIDNNKGGYCCSNIGEYVKSINGIINNKDRIRKFKEYNTLRISDYDIKNVTKEIKMIYKEL